MAEGTPIGLLLTLTQEVAAAPPGPCVTGSPIGLLLALTKTCDFVPPPTPEVAPLAALSSAPTIWVEVRGGYRTPHRPPGIPTRRGW